MTKRDIALVVVAAGQGQRLGAGKPKAFVDLVGRPLLTHAIESIIALPDLAQLILAVPDSHLIEAAQIGAELIGDLQIQFEVVLGGETRQASIANALAELTDESQIVLVHDAARALAPTSLFASVAASVRATGTSSLPVMRVVDTIKRIEGETILETVDREVLRSAQTPQGFVAAELRAAYASAEAEFTDDAALMQAAGHQILAVDGDERAFKITTPADLAAAEMRFSGQPSGSPGRGGSQWSTLPSCTLVRSPMRMLNTSARSTQLYQIEEPAPISTSPIMVQPGAMKAVS